VVASGAIDECVYSPELIKDFSERSLSALYVSDITLNGKRRSPPVSDCSRQAYSSCVLVVEQGNARASCCEFPCDSAADHSTASRDRHDPSSDIEQRVHLVSPLASNSPWWGFMHDNYSLFHNLNQYYCKNN
jgi:hypothetical protein